MMSSVLKKRFARRVILSSSSAAFLVLAAPALADDFVWTGADSNDWFNATNWDVGGVVATEVPGFGDTATINSVSTAPELTTGGTQYLKRIDIGSSGDGALTSGASLNADIVSLGTGAGRMGTLTLSGSGAEVQTNGGLIVGQEGIGRLLLSNGATDRSDRVILGDTGSTSQGIITLSGSGTSMNVGDQGLVVGNQGQGSIIVSDGARLVSNPVVIGQSAGARGEITISGAESAWDGYGNLVVGAAGKGSVLVEKGASARSGSISVGQQLTSAGSVATVTGAGSVWNVDNNVAVGGDLNASNAGGRGSLRVLDGATMNSNNFYVGYADDSIGFAQIDGKGSRLQLWQAFRVGESGTGTMTVSNGASATGDFTLIAANEGSTGTLNIESAGSMTVTNKMTVGGKGNGELNLEDDGTLNSNGGIIGRDTGSIGTVTVATGGSWNNTADLTVGADGEGSLTIENGGDVKNRTTVIGESANGEGSVTVSGASSAWSVDGDITVGAAGEGSLAIKNGGQVKSTASTVGAASGSQGSVAISGSASRWAINGGLVVGAEGEGSLTLSSGGTVSANGLTLAQSAGSSGSLNIGAASSETAAAAGTPDFDSIAFGDGDGQIVFNHTNSSYEFATEISGKGTIAVESGTTVLTGENTNSGQTNIGSGAALEVGDGGMRGTLGGNVAVGSGGSLAFNRSDNITFDGVISGDGTLEKRGEGEMTLTADSSTFTGDGQVNEGTLMVNSDLRGAVFEVAGDAALGGSGVIGTTLVNTGGTFLSGDENGSITVEGNLTFDSGARYVAVITTDQAPAVVTGDVAFDDTEIDLDFDRGGELKQAYTLLTAADISGSYDATLDALPAQFRGTLDEEDNALYLSVAYVGGDFHFSELGRSVNEQLILAFNDGQTLSGTLAAGMLQEGQSYEAAMTTLGGELGLNATMTANIGMQDFLRRATNPSRLLAGWRPIEVDSDDDGDKAIPSAPGSAALAYWFVGNGGGGNLSQEGYQSPRWDWANAGRSALFAPFNPQNSAWFEYSGQTASVDGNAAAGNSGADIKGNSFEGGYLARLDDANQVGFVFGGGTATYDQTDQDGKATDQGLRAAINAVGQTKEGIYGLAALGVGLDNMETERTVAFDSAVDRLKGKYSATTVGARVEAGGRIVNDGFALIPFIGASAVYTHAPGYSEEVLSGSGHSALAYSGADIFRGTVEAGLGFDTAAGNAARRFSLNSRVSYVYRYGNGGGGTASFLSLPGYGFSITSNAPEGSAVTANVGARIQLATQTDLSFNAYGEWGANYSALVASAKLRYIW